MPIDAQVRGLGQKYMGGRPESHADSMFQTAISTDANHPVPVSNFMNAQCKLWDGYLACFVAVCMR